MRYFRQLDGLRFIAVLLVLIEHFAYFLGRHFSAGYYGVDLFFVISGFLITSILVNSEEPFGRAYKKFIGRRTIRIFPIYYLTIVFLYIIGNKDVHQWFIYCITYSYNYASNYFDIPVNPISHFWSLGVEEQFYLFWPFIILGFRSRVNVLKLIISLLVLICGVQLYFNLFHSPVLSDLGLIPQAYALGIGALGALFYQQKKLPLHLLEIRLIEYLSFFVLAILLFSDVKFKHLICPFLSLYFVLKTTHSGFINKYLDGFLSQKWIVYIGSISYGIYLYHLPLGHYLTEYVFDPVWHNIDWASLGVLGKIRWHPWIIKFPLYSAITVILAHYSYHLLEKRLLSYKDKWFRYE